MGLLLLIAVVICIVAAVTEGNRITNHIDEVVKQLRDDLRP
jgi:hypothetical protein